MASFRATSGVEHLVMGDAWCRKELDRSTEGVPLAPRPATSRSVSPMAGWEVSSPSPRAPAGLSVRRSIWWSWRPTGKAPLAQSTTWWPLSGPCGGLSDHPARRGSGSPPDAPSITPVCLRVPGPAREQHVVLKVAVVVTRRGEELAAGLRLPSWPPRPKWLGSIV